MKKAILTIFKIVIFFIGWAIISGLIDIPSTNPAIWRFFAELIPFVVIVAFTIVFLWIEKGDLRIPIVENALKGTLCGVIVGFVWIGLSIGILLITQQLVISEKNEVTMLLLWVVAAFINVIMQELLVRGYIYQLLKKKYNMPITILITTVIFTAMHGGAFEAGIIPVVNVITMCLFTTFLYEAEGTLLAPIMSHAVWNIIGSLLGCVSLADDYPNLFSMLPSKNTIVSGGDYMIESSIVVLTINVILIFIFYLKYKKTRSKIKN